MTRIEEFESQVQLQVKLITFNDLLIALEKGMNQSFLPSAMGKKAGQTGSYSLQW